MASNPYVNKVVYGGNTLIDITDTTATADKILSGYGAYGADGAWMDGTATAGSGSAVSIVDTQDANGGTIRTITAVSLEGDTVSAATLLSGYTAHNSLGEAITGEYVPSGTATIEASRAYTVSGSGSQTISPDTGYDAMEAVALTIPAQTLPTTTAASATTGYTSKATVSRSTSDQYINIPTGYNDAGAYYKVNAVPNGSAAGPSSLSASSASVSTGTNTITLTKTGVTTTPTVSAGYVASATASTATVSLTASVTTKGAATINTSSSDQTIASGTYLTGAQTIKAVTVSGLSADKILSGTTVKIGDANDDDRIASVSGSVTFQTYYTGSGAPSSSLGSNGDIYLQTS